ncbi:MAG: hypothetical protein KA978_06270 [Deltaproteobacteria bacterium]|nr:hypothetical protein [Deltaproteobacteria bacterium]
MIPVGEKLGGRYFVLAPIDPAQVDALHEVRDAQGTVSYAQCLLGAPLPPSAFESLRGELAAIPSSRIYHRPDEVVRSTQGVPAAIFRQAHPLGLSQRLAALFSGDVDERRRAALRTLVGLFAPLAEELNNLHAVGVIHGAITIDRLHVIEDRGAERLGLSGFGIEAAARYAASKPRPGPRADFAALALALQAAMERTGARPDGAAVVRWEMIRNCARAGDHPALQSGLALANAIRQLIDEPARRLSLGNLTAVGGAALPPPAGDGGGAGAPSGSFAQGPSLGASTDPAALLASPFTAPPEVQTRADARRRRVLIAAGVAVAVVATAAIVTLTSRGAPTDGGIPARVRVSVPTRCGDEPLAPPPTIAVAAAPTALGASCLGDAQEVAVLAHVDDTLVLGRRRSTRGSRFDEGPTVVAEGVLHAGTTVSGPVGWTTWISRTGPVFGLARIDRQVQRIPVRTPGLTADSFRGAMLLRADATGAWIGTTYVVDGRARAAVVELAAQHSDEPRVATVYLISEGAAVAAIPGDPATLLLRQAVDGRTTFTAVSLPLNTLAGLSTAADADGGSAEVDPATTAMRELSAQVLMRSAAWMAPAGTIHFADLGTGAAGSSRRFLATVEDAADGGCEGEDCAGSGSVLVLEFPPRGEAVTREIEPRGRGRMISHGVNNTVVAAVTRSSDGTLVPHVLDVGSEVRAQHWVLGGLDHAAVVNCGDEAWLAFAQGSPQLRIGAMPLACALR